MIEFIFTLVLMFSLSFLLYLTARALPRIVEEPATDRKSILDRWAHSPMPEKIDTALNGFLLKFLRRVKIVLLRIDNTLGKQLRKMKVEDADKKPAIDFKDIAGQDKGGDENN